ncbi:hypothetical protein Ciccas_013164, partial [Cichlidogyrus casuarinus]
MVVRFEDEASISDSIPVSIGAMCSDCDLYETTQNEIDLEDLSSFDELIDSMFFKNQVNSSFPQRFFQSYIVDSDDKKPQGDSSMSQLKREPIKLKPLVTKQKAIDPKVLDKIEIDCEFDLALILSSIRNLNAVKPRNSVFLIVRFPWGNRERYTSPNYTCDGSSVFMEFHLVIPSIKFDKVLAEKVRNSSVFIELWLRAPNASERDTNLCLARLPMQIIYSVCCNCQDSNTKLDLNCVPLYDGWIPMMNLSSGHWSITLKSLRKFSLIDAIGQCNLGLLKDKDLKACLQQFRIFVQYYFLDCTLSEEPRMHAREDEQVEARVEQETLELTAKVVRLSGARTALDYYDTDLCLSEMLLRLSLCLVSADHVTVLQHAESCSFTAEEEQIDFDAC